MLMAKPEAENHQNSVIGDQEIKAFIGLNYPKRVEQFLNEAINNEEGVPLTPEKKRNLTRFAFVAMRAEDIRAYLGGPRLPSFIGYPALGTSFFNPKGPYLWVSKRVNSENFTPDEAFDLMVNVAAHIYDYQLNDQSRIIALKVVKFIKTITK